MHSAVSLWSTTEPITTASMLGFVWWNVENYALRSSCCIPALCSLDDSAKSNQTTAQPSLCNQSPCRKSIQARSLPRAFPVRSCAKPQPRPLTEKTLGHSAISYQGQAGWIRGIHEQPERAGTCAASRIQASPPGLEPLGFWLGANGSELVSFSLRLSGEIGSLL